MTHDGRGRTGTVLFAVGMSVVAGALYASQSRVNGQLGLRIGNGFAAAATSFAVGLAVMIVVVLVHRRARSGLGELVVELRARRFPWWGVLGGLAGGTFVLAQGTVGGLLGVAMFTIGVVAGQTVSSALLDMIGVGPSGRIPLTWPRAVGSTVAVAAVALAAVGRAELGIPLAALAFAVGVGLLLGWQQAVNGRVRQASRSAATATFLNFLTGTALLGIVLTISAPFAEVPSEFPVEPWYYLGGPMGCLFIAIGAWAVRVVGVLLYSLAAIGGQLATSLLLDLLVPAGSAVDGFLLVGAAGALLGVGLASLPPRRRDPGTPRPDDAEVRGG